MPVLVGGTSRIASRPNSSDLVCRYTGADPEPRGLPSGHMPHSFSLPFSAFLQKNSDHYSGATFTTFLPPEELHRNLEAAVGAEYARLILEGQRRVTTTCGSGMTAGILWLGLKLIDETTPVALYDEVRRAPSNGLDYLLMLAYSLGWATLHVHRVR